MSLKLNQVQAIEADFRRLDPAVTRQMLHLIGVARMDLRDQLKLLRKSAKPDALGIIENFERQIKDADLLIDVLGD